MSSDDLEQLVTLVQLCQSSPNRRPTCCPDDGEVLVPLRASDLWKGAYILLSCPSCSTARELTPREMVGFRMFGELLLRFNAR